MCPVADVVARQCAANVAATQIGAATIALTDRHHCSVCIGVPGVVVLVVLSRPDIRGRFSRARHGADRAIDVPVVCLFIRVVAVEQPGDQLHEPFSKSRDIIPAHAAD